MSTGIQLSEVNQYSEGATSKSTGLSRAALKLKKDLELREGREKIRGMRLPAKTNAMVIYDYIVGIVDSDPTYQHEVITKGELRTSALKDRKTTPAKIASSERMIAHGLSTIAAVYNCRHYGREVLAVVFDAERRVLGVQIPETREQAIAVIEKAVEKAAFFEAQSQRIQSNFAALPLNNPCKVLA